MLEMNEGLCIEIDLDEIREDRETEAELTLQGYKKARLTRFFGIMPDELGRMLTSEIDQYYMALEAIEAKEELQMLRVRELPIMDGIENAACARERKEYVERLRKKASI